MGARCLPHPGLSVVRAARSEGGDGGGLSPSVEATAGHSPTVVDDPGQGRGASCRTDPPWL